MPNLTVDRLNLRLEGISRDEAQQLAGLIAAGLAGSDIPSPANLPALRLNVSRLPGTSMPELSKQIVAGLVGQLKRT